MLPMRYHRVMADKPERIDWRVQTQPGGGFVPWRPGWALPGRWRTRLSGEHLPYDVELEFVADEERGPDCRSIRLLVRDGGEPIGARAIRDVPIAACISTAIGAAAWREGHRPGQVVYEFGGGEDVAVTEQHDLARRAVRAQTNSDEHLREVADVYRRADEKPTRAVQDHFAPVSYSTAARWVMHARRRGFLPPHRQED
jgi:hypothetical protein